MVQARACAWYMVLKCRVNLFVAALPQVLGSFIFLNVVVAVILEQFSSLGHSSVARVPGLVAPYDVERFEEVWATFDPYMNDTIPREQLPDLVLAVPPPLGLKHVAGRKQALLMCMRLDLPRPMRHDLDAEPSMLSQSEPIGFTEALNALIGYNFKQHGYEWALLGNDLNGSNANAAASLPPSPAVSVRTTSKASAAGASCADGQEASPNLTVAQTKSWNKLRGMHACRSALRARDRRDSAHLAQVFAMELIASHVRDLRDEILEERVEKKRVHRPVKRRSVINGTQSPSSGTPKAAARVGLQAPTPDGGGIDGSCRDRSESQRKPMPPWANRAEPWTAARDGKGSKARPLVALPTDEVLSVPSTPAGAVRKSAASTAATASSPSLADHSTPRRMVPAESTPTSVSPRAHVPLPHSASPVPQPRSPPPRPQSARSQSPRPYAPHPQVPRPQVLRPQSPRPSRPVTAARLHSSRGARGENADSTSGLATRNGAGSESVQAVGAPLDLRPKPPAVPELSIPEPTSGLLVSAPSAGVSLQSHRATNDFGLTPRSAYDRHLNYASSSIATPPPARSPPGTPPAAACSSTTSRYTML